MMLTGPDEQLGTVVIPPLVTTSPEKPAERQKAWGDEENEC